MSVTDVPGFVAAGIHSGIKASGDPDLALVATEDGKAVAAAGVFTSNQMTAAPVLVCRSHLEATGGAASAVVLNSGNANAATGTVGMDNARAMCALTADALGTEAESVLVCSTGLIGYPLPMDPITAGIPVVASALSGEGGMDAAEAMRTTDTVAKSHTAVRKAADGTAFRVGGIAKGAAMLEPNMATMLAVLTTDADVSSESLLVALRHGVARSFNCLTVDGAESTNDTVLILASGRAGPVAVDALTDAVTEVCRQLAMQMADDAEGSTKTIILRVSGAATNDDAVKVARDTANCQLVKCSWYGEDPYWGRIASEAGAAGVVFDPNTLTIAYGDHVVYANGEPGTPHRADLTAYMKQRHLHLNVDLGVGSGEAEVVTTDLSHAYIDENSKTS
jgi:glutamate N-acetyltransferase/amino-acid N-acetyltransferase